MLYFLGLLSSLIHSKMDTSASDEYFFFTTRTFFATLPRRNFYYCFRLVLRVLAQLFRNLGFEMNFKRINVLQLLIEQPQNVPEKYKIYAKNKYLWVKASRGIAV